MRCALLSLSLSTLVACATPPGGGGDDDSPARPDADLTDQSCGDWQTGTLTGYNNSNFADDPNAGDVMEFQGLNDAFYNGVDMAAVDFSDWDGDKYRYIDVEFNGVVGRVQV